MRYGFINNFSQALAADLAAGATTLTLDGGGSLLSNASADLVYTLTLDDGEGTLEAVHVIAATGNDLTIERGKEGTTDDAWPAGTTVEMRLTASTLSAMVIEVSGQVVSPGATTSSGDTVAIGNQANSTAYGAATYGAYATASQSNAAAFGSYAESTNYSATALGSGCSASGDGATAVGGGSTAEGDYSFSAGAANVSAGSSSAVAIGDFAVANGARSLVLGKSAATSAADAIALGPAASANEASSISVGDASTAIETNCISIGYQAQAGSYDIPSHSAPNAVCVGANSGAWGQHSVCIGANGGVEPVFGGVVVGGWAWTDNYGGTTIGANGYTYADYGTAVGFGTEVSAAEAVALGVMAKAAITGGLQTNALSYLPANYSSATVGVSTGNPDGLDLVAQNATRQSSQQVVVATDPLDLTDNTASVTLDLPAGTRLFIDAIDVIITGSDTPGGSPEIQVGPDDVTPAAYLAATVVGKIAVGGRETHSPLVSDGVTSLRVATTTAGTGTTYQAKIVFRGYVMEL